MSEDVGDLQGADVLELGDEHTLVLQGEEGTVHVGLPDDDAIEELHEAVAKAAEKGSDDGGGGGLLNSDAIDDALGGGL